MEFPERIYISPNGLRLKERGEPRYISLIKVENDVGIYEDGYSMNNLGLLEINISDGISLFTPWYKSKEVYEGKVEKYRLGRLLRSGMDGLVWDNVTTEDIKKIMDTLKIEY